MPIAYLDLPSGISGDMFLGCLVDAGWPLERLQATVEALDLPPGTWQVHAETVLRGPLRATRVHVDVTEGDAHRHLADVVAIIRGSRLPAPVQDRAVAVFTRLAEAEARVHNTTPDRIHFHEVGALDAIIDIAGVCAGLHELGIRALYAGPLPLSPGWIHSQHGPIPLPAPATLELIAAAQAPTVPGPGPGELVTPTGAALVTGLSTFQQPPMTVERVGYGAGGKEFPWPNVARLWLGQPMSRGHEATGQRDDERTRPTAHLILLETNIDDMNPELVEPVRERLFAQGALDVWTTPIGMKKGRPALMLSVLAPARLEASLVRCLLEETTTLGVRAYPVDRHEAARTVETVTTQYGPVRVKLKLLDGRVWGAKPEFEDCRRLAEEAGVPVQAVYIAAQAAAFHRWPVGGSDAKTRLVEKAAPVLLRPGPTGPQVLVFRHPQAGIQLVKGTLEPGEEPFAAAVRELAEEAGIQDAVPVRLLGALDLPEIGQRWHFVLCRVPEDLPERWTFYTQDDGGHLFEFFWHNLADLPDEEWHPAFRKALAFLRDCTEKAQSAHEP